MRYSEEFSLEKSLGSRKSTQAILMPLYELRSRMNELDKNEQYIVYCPAGGRSAVATLILSQNQFDGVSLEGGIRDWPFETASVDDLTAEMPEDATKQVATAN